MTKKRVVIPTFAAVFVVVLIVVIQLGGCHNTPLEADADKRYLDLNEIGVTVLMGHKENHNSFGYQPRVPESDLYHQLFNGRTRFSLEISDANPIDICHVATTDRK